MGAQWSAVKEAYDRVGVECCRTRDGLKVKDAASTLVSSRCAVRGFVSTPRSVHTASTTPRGIAFTPRDTARSSYSTSSHLSTPRDRDSPRTQMLTQCFECQKRPVTTVYAPARVTRLRPVGRPQVARVPAHAYERRSARALACPCPRCCVRLRRGFRKGLSLRLLSLEQGVEPCGHVCMCAICATAVTGKLAHDSRTATRVPRRIVCSNPECLRQTDMRESETCYGASVSRAAAFAQRQAHSETAHRQTGVMCAKEALTQINIAMCSMSGTLLPTRLDGVL